MNNKVLILNPPTPEGYINRDLMGGMGVHVRFGKDLFSRFLSRIKSSYVRIPVMQLVYGATLLQKEGFEVKVIDAGNEGLGVDAVINEAEKFGPAFVLMAVSSAGIIFERDVMAASLKKKIPDLKVIVVGDMITEIPNLAKPWFDVAISGEVENSIVRICRGETIDNIPGLFMQKNGEIVNTGPGKRLQQKELENLPMPSWDLFPYGNYTYYPMVPTVPVASIQASRGCPYGCGYCPYTKNQGAPWRSRSAENIFEEIIHDLKCGFKGVVFRDPLFSLDQKRVERLCDLIIENKIKIQFSIETRPELLSFILIDKLSKAGCSGINFGIEDIHPDILLRISRKPISLSLVRDIVNCCESKGIRTSCFFILGLPGSTKQTTEETILFSKELFASQVEYKVATPYPGTDLYNMAKKNKWLLNESFDTLTGYTSTIQVSADLPIDYLEKRSAKAFRDYYFSNKYLAREVVRGRFFKNCYFALTSLHR